MSDRPESPPPPPPFTPPVGGSTPFGTAPSASTSVPGWTPPPKPGLIPLLPLTLGTILSASFAVLRRNPRPVLGISFLFTGVIAVISTLLGWLAYALPADSDFKPTDALIITPTTAILILLSIALSAILQGLIVIEVARGTVGEKLKLSGLWATVRGRLGALIGWPLLIIVSVAVALVLVSFTIILVNVLALSIDPSGSLTVGGVILAVVIGLGFVTLLVWLAVRLSFVPSALTLERLPLNRAIARSWSLTAGFFWKIFGIQLLVSTMLNTVSSVVSTPASFVLTLASGFLLTSDAGALTSLLIIAAVLGLIITIAIAAITAVVQAATTALLYIDVRMRKEGLDLDLSRFVEARQSGDNSMPDPYLPGQRSTGTSV